MHQMQIYLKKRSPMNALLKWLDNPEIFRVNQLDAHSDHSYYLNYADMEKPENPLFQSLNGHYVHPIDSHEKFPDYPTILCKRS